MHVKWFTTLETRKELELKYVPKLFLGSIREGAGGGGAAVSYWSVVFPVPGNSPRSLCES